MIEVKPKVCPELEGCKRFRFHANIHTDESSDLEGDFRDRIEQAGEVGRIRAIVETLKILPCEAEIQVGSKEGQSFNSGEVRVVGAEASEHAGLIIEEILNLAYVFAQSYGGSSFTITARQTFEITEIQR